MTNSPTNRPVAPIACLAASCVLLLIPQEASAAHSSANDADARASRVADRILAAMVEANGVPGMAASVSRDGDPVWTGGAGYRDLEKRLPVEDRTIFRLASVSKILAVTAAARLHEQGRLDVDRPIQTRLGYLDPKWPNVTPRQLASHTAGIPHYQKVDEDRGGHRFNSVRESIGVFNGRDLLFAPGAGYSYSSYGYTLLSAVVEQSAGKPYLDYLAAEIVPGLTIVPDATDPANPVASKAYIYDKGALAPAPVHDFSYSWGGAGMSATAGDLARFGGRMLSGKLISNTTLEWMREPSQLADGTVIMDDGFPVGFGLRGGTDRDGERIAHHGGAAIGARSVLLLYPDRELALSIVSNAPWVTSIEQTAITLSVPFRPSRAAAITRPCPIKATRYDGSFDGKPVTGTARFAVEDGICSATISVTKSMADWFNGPAQKDAESLKIISFNTRGVFGRAALVTPFGAYDLRPSSNDEEYTVHFSDTRSLSVKFR